MEEIKAIIESRKDDLFYYSPYNFIRDFDRNKQLEYYISKPILIDIGQNNFIEVTIEGYKHFFLFSYLLWDSSFFDIKTYRLNFVLYDHNNIAILEKAIKHFLQKLLTSPNMYLFTNIPSEDINLIQALGSNSFKLIETRLAYYNNDFSSFNKERYKVRAAEKTDIPNLMGVAREMRNNYDRFHADKIFSSDVADGFLAKYVEESVKGYTDVTLVPAEENTPSDSFITANYLKSEWLTFGINISKMVLSAVSGKTNKGWHRKLMSEMTYHLRDQGAEYIFYTTQSTNRAVIHNLESLDYKYGSSIHVFSINS